MSDTTANGVKAWYKYKFWCLQENEDPQNPGVFLGGYVETLSDDPSKPLVCPNNKDHAVNPDSRQDLEERNPASTFIDVERTGKTGGHYRCDCFCLTVPPNSTGTRTLSFGFPVTIIRPRLFTLDSQFGDIFEVSFPYSAPVGVLTQAASAGDSVINVTPTVLQHSMVGFDVQLWNGSTIADFVGRIKSISVVNSTLTLSRNHDNLGYVQQACPAGTYVKLGRAFIDKVKIGRGDIYTFNEGNFIGAYLPEDTFGNLVYTNVNSAPAEVVLHVDYMY
jgi:hypothetical protein